MYIELNYRYCTCTVSTYVQYKLCVKGKGTVLSLYRYSIFICVCVGAKVFNKYSNSHCINSQHHIIIIINNPLQVFINQQHSLYGYNHSNIIYTFTRTHSHTRTHTHTHTHTHTYTRTQPTPANEAHARPDVLRLVQTQFA